VSEVVANTADSRSLWRWVTLADVGKVITGNTPPTSDAENYGDAIPFVKPTELVDRGIRSAPSGLSTQAIGKARVVPAGAVLVSCIGNLGKTGIAKVPLAFNQQINAVVFNENVLPEFGFYYAQTLKPWLYGESSATTIPIVNKGKFQQARFPLAPMSEQRAIVAEIEKQFSRLDEAVANLQRVKANLKRYKVSVLKAAVEGRLVETEASIAQREGRSYETGEQLLQSTLVARQAQWFGRGKYKTPEPPQVSDASLPEGWAWATLEQLHLQIADVDHKMPKAQDAGIPYISTKDFFGDEGVDFTKAKLISAEDYEALCRKVKPERGDLLLSRYGTVGEVREVSIDGPFQASYSVAILKPVRGFVPIRFLIAALRSDVVQRQIKRDVRATAQPDLGLAHIRQFVVPVPPMAEQLRILEELDRQLSILRGMEAEVENNLLRAQKLRQSTLSKAFT
jgi:type I restriction enzyme S subunit